MTFLFIIKVGDLILLKKNEVCPADMLILDMAENKCYVDTFSVDGKSSYSIKNPMQSTYCKE